MIKCITQQTDPARIEPEPIRQWNPIATACVIMALSLSASVAWHVGEFVLIIIIKKL